MKTKSKPAEKTRSRNGDGKKKAAVKKPSKKSADKQAKKPVKKPVKKPAGKAALKDVASKVVETVKKIVEKVGGKKLPFGGKVGRKKKVVISEDAQSELDSLREDELIDRLEQGKTETGRSDPAADFFYTPDKFINQFDDVDIFAFIRDAYPDFMRSGDSETKVRRSIQRVLDDEAFVKRIMKLFDITIFEFFKLLFRADPAVFKKPFLQGLHKQVLRKSYYPKNKG